VVEDVAGEDGIVDDVIEDGDAASAADGPAGAVTGTGEDVAVALGGPAVDTDGAAGADGLSGAVDAVLGEDGLVDGVLGADEPDEGATRKSVGEGDNVRDSPA
ncbi:hypothetical protein, partial [Isoptericola haloaureus]